MNIKEKAGNLFGGIIAGIIMIIVGIGLLWWNEGRTVKVQKGINEAKDVYIEVKSDKIDNKNDGKLIATNGKLDLSESSSLIDDVFGIKADSALMERKVEMFQWKETCETDSNDKETCSYKKEWDDQLIDSSDFKQSNSHTNPTSMPYDSEEFVATNVRMGAFTLPEDLIKRLSTKKEKKNTDLTSEYKVVEGYEVVNNYITNVKEGETPNIGDIRISFSYNDATSVSVLAVQTGDTLTKYTTKSGTSIYRIKEGTHNGQEIIQDMVNENTTIKWLLRLLGVLLDVFGIAAIFSPIQKLTGFVPIVGSAVSAITGLISLVLGLAISLVVIAVAWLRFRPILSICLFAVVAILIVLLIMLKNKNKKKEVSPADTIVNGNNN